MAGAKAEKNCPGSTIQKVAVINDLSGFGKCSLTAAISVIAAMGVQPCPLPTAVFSAQTGYPSYSCRDLTENMEEIRREWEKMGARFAGIYTGFLSDAAQADQILRFLDTFYRPGEEGCFLLVDPVMGDDGEVFPVFTPRFPEVMRRLAARADIVTPNLTELCLLTGADFREFSAIADKDKLVCMTVQAAEELMQTVGPQTVVVTGLKFADEETGTPMMGNLGLTRRKRDTKTEAEIEIKTEKIIKTGTKTETETKTEIKTDTDICLTAYPLLGASYSGTGDLFASVLAGGTARGDAVQSSVELAGRFIYRAIEDTVQEQVPQNDGINYERYLSMLLPK